MAIQGIISIIGSMHYNYRFRNCLLLAVMLLGWASVGCTRLPRRELSPRQLGLNQIQLWRLRKFVAEQSSDHYRCTYHRQFNTVRDYRFWATATLPGYIGLISVIQTNHSHGARLYFINGRHRITPLDLRPVRCGQAEYVASIDTTTAEKNRRRQVVEDALRRHANELPDSLQQRIQLLLYSRYKL